MTWRVFVTVAFLAVVSAGAGYLVEGGWVPWTVPIALLIVGVALAGFIARRRRGTQTTSANRPKKLPPK